MDYMPFIWILIIVIASITEAFTAQLVSVWFVLGAVASLIASLITSSLWIQVVVFIVVTLISLILTRPIVKRVTSFEKVKTNADKYIGKTGVVIKEINNELGVGQVNILGSIWTAVSCDGSIIAEGENVLVESIQGVKLKVKTVYKEN